MDELKGLKSTMVGVKAPDRIIIIEMIKEAEEAIKKSPEKKREILIELHNDINNRVIDEPLNKTFIIAKSRMDEIISSF